MLANFLLLLAALVYADPSDLEYTKDMPSTPLVLNSSPTYRDPNMQKSNSTKVYGIYTKESASYRTPIPQTRVMEGNFRVPTPKEGLVQDITVVVPTDSRIAPKVFYDQLVQGKAPRKCSKYIYKISSSFN